MCTNHRRRWLRWLALPLALLVVTVKLLQQQLLLLASDTGRISLRSKAPLNDVDLNLAGGAGSNLHDGKGTGKTAGRRVAVCFFGLTRSLRWTLPSVQRRLLGVLEQAGMRVDVFVHTYDLAEVNNLRAGEMGLEYGSYVNDFQALNPVRSLVTNQDDFDLAWPNPLASTHYNWVYEEKYASGVIRNVLRAYWSMSMVWGLMAEHAVQGRFQYDSVVLARPDVWFHYDVDLPSRAFPLPEKTVFIPSFDAEEAAGERKNDRFAYGSVTAMRVVMNRIATLLEAGGNESQGKVDSEWVLGHHLQKHGISVRFEIFQQRFPWVWHTKPLSSHSPHCSQAHMLSLLVTRVRLTRDIPRYDQRVVKEACRSGEDPMACRIVDADFLIPVDGGSA
ncbi:unnamed protein product [Pylaiella littoralis]